MPSFQYAQPASASHNAQHAVASMWGSYLQKGNDDGDDSGDDGGSDGGDGDGDDGGSDGSDGGDGHDSFLVQ